MIVQGALCLWQSVTLSCYISSQSRYKTYYIGDSEITISKLSITLTISIIFINIGMALANIKSFNFSNRIKCIVSVLGISGSMFSLSFANHFFLIIIIYGGCFGFFIGYGYIAPLNNSYTHLPLRKGIYI